jgi:UDP-glucuronate 4-epimerase
MAVYKFTDKISDDKEIEMYGDGSSKRDYTYITDIVSGIIASLDADVGYEIINLGNHETVELSRLISTIEKHLNKKAIIKQKPMPPEDVDITFADISKAQKLIGYEPKTSIDEGIKKFIEWYKENHQFSS